jgi:hypothetical protein
LWNGAALALLASTALILLAAPFFPSQDGPVHLYYADVLRGLLTHSAPYAQYFEIKSLLTPYALEYYALLALETVFSPAVSEKLLLAGYILAFGLGFRYLVESVAERGSPWTVAGIPFCLHLLVYMGFLNFCLAVALLLFLCGFWIRFSERLTRGRVAVLLSGLVLMLLTHPVPVAVFLLFILVYVLTGVATEAAVGPASGPASWKAWLRARRRTLVLMTAMGAMALLWVGLFVDRLKRAPTDASYASVYGWLVSIATEVQLYPVMPFRHLLYRAGPMLLVGLACATLIDGFLAKGRRWPVAAIALAATGAICFALYLILPPNINGSFYFAERFPILWVLFFLAACAALRPGRRWNMAAGCAAAFVTVVLLMMQWRNVSAIGQEIAPVLNSPPARAGSLGLIVGSETKQPAGLSFDPYMWSGAHYCRRSRAILGNEPWMTLPLIMLRPVHPSRWDNLDPKDAGRALARDLLGGVAFRRPDFVVQSGLPDSEIDGLLNRQGWSASGDGSRFLRIYRARP